MTDKPSRQIDTPIKLCYSCDSKAIIIIQKKYYCADCGLRKTTTRIEYENIQSREDR
jgi:hypothetical protein